MNVVILGRTWRIASSNELDKDIAMCTEFPERLISYNKMNIHNDQMLKHFVSHEVTHAYQAELGQWQNALGNGSRTDSFDSEWIAEFIAIHGEGIIEVTNNILNLFKMKEE